MSQLLREVKDDELEIEPIKIDIAVHVQKPLDHVDIKLSRAEDEKQEEFTSNKPQLLME